MTRNEANTFLAIILQTVAESPDGAPLGVMYAAMVGHISLEDFGALMLLCADMGLVHSRNHVATLTAKGRDMVGKIDAHRRVAS